MSEMGDMKFTTTGDMMKPTLIMLVGLPGTGKSTWIRDQGFWDRWDSADTMVLSTDNFIESVASGEGKTYSEVFPMAIKAAEKNLEEGLEYAIQTDMNIVWDQTNLSVSSRKKKLRKIPAHYRKVAKVFLPTDEHEAWLNSPERAGKVIPKNVLDSMQATFQMPTVDEGFDEVIVPVRF